MDAVVANAPVLRYLVSRQWQGTLRVSEVILQPLSYAIGLPTGSPLRTPINHSMLGIIEQDEHLAVGEVDHARPRVCGKLRRSGRIASTCSSRT